MSIIYEALKKAQQSRKHSVENKIVDQSKMAHRVISFSKVKHHIFSMKKFMLDKKRIKPMLSVGFVVFGSLALISIIKNTGYQRLITDNELAKLPSNISFNDVGSALRSIIMHTPRHIAISEAEYKSKHQLNGVFISEHETVAMINKSLYHRGDMIDGMVVDAINTAGVKMKHDNQAVFLRIQS